MKNILKIALVAAVLATATPAVADVTLEFGFGAPYYRDYHYEPYYNPYFYDYGYRDYDRYRDHYWDRPYYRFDNEDGWRRSYRHYHHY